MNAWLSWRVQYNRLSKDLSLLFSVRTNDLPLENEEPAVGRKLYIYTLQPELQVLTCYNVRLMYWPGALLLNPPHATKRQRGSKYILIDFVEAAKIIEDWVGIVPCSQLFRYFVVWLDGSSVSGLLFLLQLSHMRIEDVNVGYYAWTLAAFERTSMIFFPNMKELCSKKPLCSEYIIHNLVDLCQSVSPVLDKG